MMTTNERTTDEIVDFLMDSLKIRKVAPRPGGVGGSWVSGTIGGHSFDALVFEGHAECETYEIDDSRISKLWVQRLCDRETVANFDRGWDIRPNTEGAKLIVNLLADGLADFVFND